MIFDAGEQYSCIYSYTGNDSNLYSEGAPKEIIELADQLMISMIPKELHLEITVVSIIDYPPSHNGANNPLGMPGIYGYCFTAGDMTRPSAGIEFLDRAVPIKT